jgi:hypothetical protein
MQLIDQSVRQRQLEVRRPMSAGMNMCLSLRFLMCNHTRTAQKRTSYLFIVRLVYVFFLDLYHCAFLASSQPHA